MSFLLKQLHLHNPIVLAPGIRDILHQSDSPFQSLHPQSYLELVIHEMWRDEHALQFILKLLQRTVDVDKVLKLIFDFIVSDLVQSTA